MIGEGKRGREEPMPGMRRREVLTALGAAATWPLAARAQQAERMQRIGVLVGSAEDESDIQARLAGFRQGLEKLGWSEGRNVRIDTRFAAGRPDQFPVLAKELVALQPDVILAHSPPITAALQRESRAIPIVFVSVSDPIGAGFVTSLARPGGNITGMLQYEAGIAGKWLAMLKEIAPRIARAALVFNPKTTANNYFLGAAESAAASLAIELVPSPVETAADIDRIIESVGRAPNSGLLLPPDTTTIIHRDLIIALAARHRLPTVYPGRVFVAAGGLMSYGTDQVEIFRQAASYVDRILRGAKAADLPVQAPTKYETTLNLKTAKALGLDVPPSLLVRADEVIE
jgi:putative ABC transport system substrate-binding protein